MHDEGLMHLIHKGFLRIKYKEVTIPIKNRENRSTCSLQLSNTNERYLKQNFENVD